MGPEKVITKWKYAENLEGVKKIENFSEKVHANAHMNLVVTY